MERLTQRDLHGDAWARLKNYAINDCGYYGRFLVGDISDKLADYEDAEEQGLLKKFVVDIGDKVWTITSPANYSLGKYAEVALNNPQEKKVQSITVSKNGVAYHVKDRTYGIYDFGKTVFRTKEEAEQALAEMKEV